MTSNSTVRRFTTESLQNSGDTVFQIQPPPGTRGTLPRTPCLAVITAQNNQSVIIDDCTAETELRAFRVTNGGSTTGAGPAGPIVLFNTLCLEPAGAIASGTKVQINTCDTTKPSQNWQWNSNGTVNIAGSNQCLDLTDGNLSNGIQVSQEAPRLSDQIWCIDCHKWQFRRCRYSPARLATRIRSGAQTLCRSKSDQVCIR